MTYNIFSHLNLWIAVARRNLKGLSDMQHSNILTFLFGKNPFDVHGTNGLKRYTALDLM